MRVVVKFPHKAKPWWKTYFKIRAFILFVFDVVIFRVYEDPTRVERLVDNDLSLREIQLTCRGYKVKREYKYSEFHRRYVPDNKRIRL